MEKLWITEPLVQRFADRCIGSETLPDFVAAERVEIALGEKAQRRNAGELTQHRDDGFAKGVEETTKNFRQPFVEHPFV